MASSPTSRQNVIRSSRGGSEPAQDVEPSRANVWGVVLGCLAILVLDGMDLQLLAFSGPTLMREFGADKFILSLAIGCTLIGMTIGAPLGGWLGDRHGPRITLIMTAFLFGFATLASAAATSMDQIITLRFVSGVGFGSAVPNAMALAGGWVAPRSRGPVVGLLTTGTSIGGVIGGVLCGWLLPLAGWRTAFAISGCLTLLVPLAMIALMPESPRFLALRAIRRRPAYVTDADMAVAVPQPEGSGVAAENIAIFSRALAAVNAKLWIMFFAAAYTAYGFLSWTPTIIVDAGMPLTVAISSTTAYSFCTIGGALIATYLSNQVSLRTTILASSGVKLGLALIIGGLLSSFATGHLPLLLGLGGLCIGLLQTSLYVLASKAYPFACRTRAIGLCVGFSRAGGIAIAFAGGAILSIGSAGPLLFFMTIAGMMACTALASLALRKELNDQD